MTTPFDLFGVSRLQKQRDSFLKIIPRILNRVALSGNIQLGAYIAIAFALNDGRNLLDVFHRSHSSVVIQTERHVFVLKGMGFRVCVTTWCRALSGLGIFVLLTHVYEV